MFKLTQLSVLAAAASLVSVVGVAQAQVVKIDGSSTVFPITEGVAEDFQKLFEAAL